MDGPRRVALALNTNNRAHNVYVRPDGTVEGHNSWSPVTPNYSRGGAPGGGGGAATGNNYSNQNVIDILSSQKKWAVAANDLPEGVEMYLRLARDNEARGEFDNARMGYERAFQALRPAFSDPPKTEKDSDMLKLAKYLIKKAGQVRGKVQGKATGAPSGINERGGKRRMRASRRSRRNRSNRRNRSCRNRSNRNRSCRKDRR